MKPFSAHMILGELRDTLAKHLAAGVRCPVCDRPAQIRQRTISEGQARALRALYVAHHHEFGHLASAVLEHCPDVASQGGYTNQTAHWGLMQSERAVRGDDGRPGYWRVTARGSDWLIDRIAVPRYAHIYNERAHRLDGPPMRVTDVLPFDLVAVLAPDPHPELGPVALFPAEPKQAPTNQYGTDAA